LIGEIVAKFPAPPPKKPAPKRPLLSELEVKYYQNPTEKEFWGQVFWKSELGKKYKQEL
jgi:hypothetical protein